MNLSDLTDEHFASVELDISQPKNGYRYGEAALALANYCDLKTGERVAELGSGVGVVALVLAKKFTSCTFDAIEIQQSLHEIARFNAEKNKIDIVNCINLDWREFAKISPSLYDAAISNPPFFKKGACRPGANAQRNIARQEVKGEIDDLLASVLALIKPHGRLYIVFAGERKEELISKAAKLNFNLLHEQPVNSKYPTGDFLVKFEKMS